MMQIIYKQMNEIKVKNCDEKMLKRHEKNKKMNIIGVVKKYNEGDDIYGY